MSTLTTTPKSSTQSIPANIEDRLGRLRGKITRFILVDGLSRVLAVGLVLVLLDVVFDRFFKMDLAQRFIVLCVMVAILLGIVVWRLIRPLTRRPGDDALVLEVEDHNRELAQSLISSVQFSRDRQQMDAQGYSGAMVDATIRQGSGLADKIDFGNAINRGALARNLLLLLVSIVGLGAISWGVVNTDLWRTWFNRNILLTNDQWPRNTVLSIVGVVDGQMVLPRGEDHKQFVEVLADSPTTDVDVTIEFDDGNTRTKQKMRRTGNLEGREHLLVFRNVANEFRFRAIGGDDTTGWVEVGLVDPPGWSDLQLNVRPPAYTGISQKSLPPGGGPYSVLSGSSLEIVATANKSLSEASLNLSDRNWPLQPVADDQYQLSIPTEELVGGKYTFDLVDSGGLRSSRPAAFTIKIKPDRAPTVRATLLGISGLVVPRARIPVSWTATDEYAVTRAEFVFDWSSDSPGSVPQEGSIDLATLGSETSVLLGRPEVRTVDVLDLEPLQVPTGVGLNLAVSATDNNTLSGPGVGESRKFLLRVVTEDELRSDLLRREIEQRKAFELILKNQEELQVDLRALAARASGELNENDVASDLLAWLRRQKLVGTNISTIADRFEEFLVEVKNNRLDEAENEIDASRSIEVRFNERIIQPIRQLDQTTIIEAVQLLDQSQRLLGNAEGFGDSLTTTADKQDEIIEAMRAILSAMQDSETYQEVVNLAIEVKRRQEKVRELTREEKAKTDTDDIFDDQADDDVFDREMEPDENNDGETGDDGRPDE